MAEVLLFHHIQGCTPGVEAFADTLRAAGHLVHVPDLFDGLMFDSIDAGVAHVDNVGFDAMIDRGVASATEHRAEVVYAGMSLGVLPAQKLAQTRPGSAGAVLLEACVPATVFADEWPEGVPVQIHGMSADPFFAGEGEGEGRIAPTRPALSSTGCSSSSATSDDSGVGYQQLEPGVELGPQVEG